LGHLKVVYCSRGFNTTFYFILFAGKIFLANAAFFYFYFLNFYFIFFVGVLRLNSRTGKNEQGLDRLGAAL